MEVHCQPEWQSHYLTHWLQSSYQLSPYHLLQMKLILHPEMAEKKLLQQHYDVVGQCRTKPPRMVSAPLLVPAWTLSGNGTPKQNLESRLPTSILRHIIPTSDKWKFFSKYLFILEKEVRQFHIWLSRISTVLEQVCKVNLVLCFCNNNQCLGQ